jgi:flagellin
VSASGTFTISSLDISSLTDDAADLTTLEGYITGATQAIEDMTSAAASMGAVKARIDIQKSFVSNLMDAIDKGVGQLVDADMNEESTKLQALQVQAQLGVQALSIANQSSQNILSLFR